MGEVRSTSLMGQRRQRPDDQIIAHIGAEITFQAPDGHKDISVDAITLLDGGKHLRMFFK